MNHAEDVAKAADLVLKRIQQDLDRGKIDQQLLDQLGWTAEDLKAFTERISNQLEERSENAQKGHEKSLSQKSFEEMLRSIDLTTKGQERTGGQEGNIQQMDTTLRQSTPPSRFREQYRMYQRSISGNGGTGSNQP